MAVLGAVLDARRGQKAVRFDAPDNGRVLPVGGPSRLMAVLLLLLFCCSFLQCATIAYTVAFILHSLIVQYLLLHMLTSLRYVQVEKSRYLHGGPVSPRYLIFRDPGHLTFRNYFTICVVRYLRYLNDQLFLTRDRARCARARIIRTCARVRDHAREKLGKRYRRYRRYRAVLKSLRFFVRYLKKEIPGMEVQIPDSNIEMRSA